MNDRIPVCQAQFLQILREFSYREDCTWTCGHHKMVDEADGTMGVVARPYGMHQCWMVGVTNCFFLKTSVRGTIGMATNWHHVELCCSRVLEVCKQRACDGRMVSKLHVDQMPKLVDRVGTGGHTFEAFDIISDPREGQQNIPQQQLWR